MELKGIQTISGSQSAESSPRVNGAKAEDFKEALARAGASLAEGQNAAARAVEQFTRGADGDLHQTMLAIDKAEISVRLLVNVRNRLVEAYREVMRMGM